MQALVSPWCRLFWTVDLARGFVEIGIGNLNTGRDAGITDPAVGAKERAAGNVDGHIDERWLALFFVIAHAGAPQTR
jgi:hypothetical protein